MMKRQPTKEELESQKRIIELINERCNGSQQQFADRAGIGKSSVSQYVNGTNFPSNKRAAQIAKAFNVNPVWVMGFDASKRTNISSNAPTDGQSQSYYEDPKARELAEFLHCNPDYSALFDAAKSVPPEDLEFVRQMIERMGGKD